MLQLSIEVHPSGRILVIMIMPEETIEGYQLGSLLDSLSCLVQFGLSGAVITELKEHDFLSAKNARRCSFLPWSLYHISAMDATYS